MAKAPTIGEEIANETINQNGSMTTRDQLHDTMNISAVETFSKEDLLEEGPSNRVIGLLEI